MYRILLPKHLGLQDAYIMSIEGIFHHISITSEIQCISYCVSTYYKVAIASK